MLWDLPEITTGRIVATNFYLNNGDMDTEGYFLRAEFENDGRWRGTFVNSSYEGRLSSDGTQHETIGFTLQSLTLQQDPGDYTCRHLLDMTHSGDLHKSSSFMVNTFTYSCRFFCNCVIYMYMYQYHTVIISHVNKD